MRPRTALALWGTALVLGSLVGLLVPGTGAAGGRAPGTASPSAGTPIPTAPVTTPGTTPSPAGGGTSPGATASDPSGTAGPTPSASAALKGSDLLGAGDFERIVVDVAVDLGRRPQGDLGVTACTEQNPPGRRTFRDLTGQAPELLGLYRQASSGDTAGEVAATTGSDAAADAAARRLLDVLSACERSDPGRPVYGRPTRLDLADGLSASWFGSYVEEREVDGRAPEGEEPCGGVVVATAGPRVAVLDVAICVSSAQLDTLARRTAQRLR